MPEWVARLTISDMENAVVHIESGDDVFIPREPVLKQEESGSLIEWDCASNS